MLLTEWNTEECIAVRSEEAREEGLEKGLMKGREEGHKDVIKLLEQGLSVEEIKQRLASAT